MSKTVHIGNSSDAPFLAYGDESKKGDVIVYAYFLFQRKYEKNIGRQIRYIKNDFRIPLDVALHCKTLLHGDALKKKGLDHLTGYDGFSIIRRVVTLFNDFDMEVRYAYESLHRVATQMGGHLILRDDEGASPHIEEITHSYQGHLGLLSLYCLADSRRVPPAMCQFFAGEEDAKVKFIGQKNQRADSRYGGFSDIGAPGGSVFHIQPAIVKLGSHFGLELADIAAYLCVNALQPGEHKNPFYREQLNRIKIWTSFGSPITQ